MNVQREFDAADRRVQAQIDASAREALIRLGVDVDEMDRLEAEAQWQATLEIFTEFGRAWGALIKTLTSCAEALALGFEEGAR